MFGLGSVCLYTSLSWCTLYLTFVTLAITLSRASPLFQNIPIPSTNTRRPPPQPYLAQPKLQAPSQPAYGPLRYIMTDQQLPQRQDTPTASTITAVTATATATASVTASASSLAAPAQAAPSSPAPQAQLIPAEDPEDTIDHDRYDIDSALGSDAASFLYPESVTASIFEYRTIQGRTYHSDRHATEYFTPNDEQQLQSVDISHHYLTILLDNNLFLAPISPHVQKVLDVGTGSGIWAIDFADTYPSAQVIGSDLSPCQPEWVPPNVHFEIADASLPWPWKDNYFDFVHIRYLFGAIHDWPALFHEAYRCCASGGWVQSCEADVHFYSDDGTAETEPGFKMWGDLYEGGGVTTGKPFFLQREAIQERSITEAGFTDIKILDYKLPVGGWPNNRKLAEVGEYVKLTLENDLEGYTFYLWHNMLNWPPEEYLQFITAMHKSLNNRKAHGYMMVRYVYGRKP
ncbi:S-adenosyl-L-methionine-dependent methyltransferase [Fusarium avenaceum]|nr:S-adenosyl-L-methionine-dependent methyltransferase [Fusarium avenaceum]